MRQFWFWALVSLLWTPAVWAGETSAPRYHTVYSGQRLGSIAKRYGVSVEAIRTANALDRAERIRPGQKLLIPAKDDPDGDRARSTVLAKTESSSERKQPTRSDDSDSGQLTHRVYAGQRLGSIAKRYRVSVDELCAANKIDRRDKLRPGQILIIPGQAHAAESEPESDEATRGHGSWHKFAHTPRRKGYVELITYSSRFQGQAMDRKGRVSDKAAEAISQLLGASGNRPRIDPRLIKLLVQVSDKFGRPIRIVSGYRTRSFYKDSRHKLSRAVDFSVPGVPNDVVRDYIRTFRNAGVGYYPNSTFVHLDVRDGSTYWVDYAGPGESPRNALNRSHGSVEDAEVGEPNVVEEEERGAAPSNTEEPPSASNTSPSEADKSSAKEPEPAPTSAGALPAFHP